jgi:hypothetical protein
VAPRKTTLVCVVFALPSLPLLLGAEASCGSDPAAREEPLRAEDAARPFCPRDLAEMNGAACNDPGLECHADFACEVTTQLVRCTCQASRWRCRDSVGALDPGALPRCVDPSPTEDECPASIPSAQGAACSTLGRLCFYEGQRCSNRITKLDFCTCKRTRAGTMTYFCGYVRCPLAELED